MTNLLTNPTVTPTAYLQKADLSPPVDTEKDTFSPIIPLTRIEIAKRKRVAGYWRGRILHAQTVRSFLGDSFGHDEPRSRVSNHPAHM